MTWYPGATSYNFQLASAPLHAAFQRLSYAWCTFPSGMNLLLEVKAIVLEKNSFRVSTQTCPSFPR